MFENYLDSVPSASLKIRFLNFLIDTLIIRLLLIPVQAFGISIMVINTKQIENIKLAWFFVELTFYFGYYVFFEGIFQRTPAKFLTRTKVVMENGERPHLHAIFIRTLVRFVPFEPLSFLFGSSGGWHDAWSKTKFCSNSYKPDVSGPPPPPKF